MAAWLEHDAAGRSQWVWPGDSTALRGSALLAPAMAQHTRVVRVREAISEAEIGLLCAAAERHVKDHSDEGLGGPSDVADKLYLHHRHIPTELLPLVAKIEQVQLRVLTSRSPPSLFSPKSFPACPSASSGGQACGRGKLGATCRPQTRCFGAYRTSLRRVPCI